MSQQMQFWTRSLFLQIIANILQLSSSLSLIQQTMMSDKWRRSEPPSSLTKDFLIIKANLGSDTVIYN